MKFLAFADLHQDKKKLKSLVERAAKPDIDFVVCAGDLSIFGRGLREALEAFQTVRKKIYFIPGNHEEEIRGWEKLVEEYSFCENIHQKALVLENYVFLGYGGSGFSQQDIEFRKKAREWYGEHQGKKIILVTHGPPIGTKLDFIDGRQVGNLDYRRFIERIKPKVAISGHIHETAGIVDKIGPTQVINPGCEGMIIELK